MFKKAKHAIWHDVNKHIIFTLNRAVDCKITNKKKQH